MYQQFRIKAIEGQIATSIDNHWLNITYEGEDNSYMSFFFPNGLAREEIAEKIGDFRDSLTDQLVEFQKRGECLNGDKITLQEAQVNAGNAAFKVWQLLPEPKLKYPDYWYTRRKQSLSEALEGCQLGRPGERGVCNYDHAMLKKRGAHYCENCLKDLD